MSEKEQPIRHFIIAFDRVAGRQVRFDELPNVKAALETYRALEKENQERGPHDQLDIVLVGSDSPDTVRVTHASYFVDEGPDMIGLHRFLGDFASSRGAARLHSHQTHAGRSRFLQEPLHG